jgi:hypothetical protein
MTINDALVVPSWIEGRPYNPDTLGLQAREEWAAGETEGRPVVDAQLNTSGAWRVSIVGDVVLSAKWGSKGTKHLTNMDAPLMGVFPGQVSITAAPRTSDGASCIVTLAPAWTGYLTDFRRFIVHPGGAPTPLEPVWSHYQALTASVIDVRGTAVAVPALSRMPLVSGSSHVSGAGYLEYTP